MDTVKDAIVAAVATAWTDPTCAHKPMDAALAKAITKRVEAVVEALGVSLDTEVSEGRIAGVLNGFPYSGPVTMV